MIVTQAALAKRLGVNRSTVFRACQAGGRLALAVSGAGIDDSHAAVRSWLAERGAPESPFADERVAELEAQLGDLRDVSLDAVMGMTLRQITDRFGGVDGFKQFVDARRSLAYARRAEHKERIDRLDLIPSAVLDRHCERLQSNRSAQGLGWSLTSGRRRARDGTIVDGSTPTGVS